VSGVAAGAGKRVSRKKPADWQDCELSQMEEKNIIFLYFLTLSPVFPCKNVAIWGGLVFVAAAANQPSLLPQNKTRSTNSGR
jgi:hypothetical protein